MYPSLKSQRSLFVQFVSWRGKLELLSSRQRIPRYQLYTSLWASLVKQQAKYAGAYCVAIVDCGTVDS